MKTMPLILIALSALSGCVSFYNFRCVPATVIDADTRQVIAGAMLHVDYTGDDIHMFSPSWSAVTGVDGVAVVRTARRVGGMSATISWSACADGYNCCHASAMVDRYVPEEFAVSDRDAMG